MTTTTGVRIIKPNIEQIIKLRHGKPPHPSRPAEIKSIVFADDDVDISFLARMILSFKLQIEPLNLSEVPEATEQEPPIIVMAGSHGEISSLSDFVMRRQGSMLMTDNDMYEFSGVQITRDLRNRGFAGWIIGMTGRKDKVGAFTEAGADLAFLKPVEYDHLSNLFILA